MDIETAVDLTSLAEVSAIRENVYALKDKGAGMVDQLNSAITDMTLLCRNCPLEKGEYNGSIACLGCNVGSQIQLYKSQSQAINGAIYNADQILELL